MPVYSMTGYATVQSTANTSGTTDTPADLPQSGSMGLENRSVNSRFLDLTAKWKCGPILTATRIRA